MIAKSQRVSSLYMIIDAYCFLVSFWISYALRYSLNVFDLAVADLFYFQEYTFVFVLWGFFIIAALDWKELYKTRRDISLQQEAGQVILCVFYASILIAGIVFFSQYKFFSRQVFLSSFVLLCVTLVGWRALKRFVLRRMIARGFRNSNVLIIGAGKIGQLMVEEIQAHTYWGLRVKGFLDDARQGMVYQVPVLGKLENFSDVVKTHFIDEVIVTIPSAREKIGALIMQAKEMSLGVRVVPEGFMERIPVVSISQLGIMPVLTYQEYAPHPSELALKRLMDVVMALGGLLLLAPVFLVIALWVKCDSPGAVFYTQQRVGWKGRRFKLYKFRSMVADADQRKPALLSENEVFGGVIFKMKNDPRVTRVGRFLRRYSLDELPQLWNVFKGDMSMVGPRPPTPQEVDQYNSDDNLRLSVRPGITCLSQIKGRSDLSFQEWVKWDLWYVKHWSWGLDFQIMLETIPVVLKGEGAY